MYVCMYVIYVCMNLMYACMYVMYVCMHACMHVCIDLLFVAEANHSSVERIVQVSASQSRTEQGLRSSILITFAIRLLNRTSPRTIRQLVLDIFVLVLGSFGGVLAPFWSHWPLVVSQGCLGRPLGSFWGAFGSLLGAFWVS